MPSLSDLGLKKDWTYEVIISCYHGDNPHTAPFGIKSTDMKNVRLELYRGSETLGCILDKKDFAINLVDDPSYFFSSLFNREQIGYSDANTINAPILTDASAYIEARMTDYTEREQYYIVNADIVDMRIKSNVKLFNRAESLIIESLIAATRIRYLPEGKAEEILRENCRVIKKVAPDSSFVDIMEKILNKCEFLVRK